MSRCLAVLASLLFVACTPHAFAELNWFGNWPAISDSWDGSSDFMASSTKCITSTDASGSNAENYGVLMTGAISSGKNKPFALNNAAGKKDVINISDTSYGVVSGMVNRVGTSTVFAGGISACETISITIAKANHAAATPGATYFDSISVCPYQGSPPNIEKVCGPTVSLDVTLSIIAARNVIVRNLGDITLTHSLGLGASGVDQFCIGTDNPAGVNIRATSANPNGTEFQLQDLAGNSQFIPYTITLAGQSLAQGAGQTPLVLTTADGVDDLNCINNGISVQLDALESEIEKVNAGAYQDTLSFLVSPE